MDFFGHQEQAKRQSGYLVVLFGLGVISVVLLLYLAVAFMVRYRFLLGVTQDGPMPWWVALWDTKLFLYTAGISLALVAVGTLTKMQELREGGRVVAESLGGRLVSGDSANPHERKILNVVEEMAIASGVPVPQVFILERERGINAFAAGSDVDDAVIGVTLGCVQLLSRDELQGVVAHEFSHILNGDMRLNMRLMGVLNGLLMIGNIGYWGLRLGSGSSRGLGRSRKSGIGWPLMALALAMYVLGFAGHFIGSLIKAAVGRQREFLADASAVQFTRDPEGIAGALKKIGGWSQRGRLVSSNAIESSHLFFTNAISRWFDVFDTHPELSERISRVQPSWDGEFPGMEGHAVSSPPEVEKTNQPVATAIVGASVISVLHGSRPLPHKNSKRAGTPTSGSTAFPSRDHLAYSREVVASMPHGLRSAVREPFGARAAIYVLLLSADDAVRRHQARQIHTHSEDGVWPLVKKLAAEAQQLSLEARIPLLELAIPALRQLSPSQHQRFISNVNALAQADRRISLFEWMLQRMLQQHLKSGKNATLPQQRQPKSIFQLQAPMSVVLSTLARSGNETESNAGLAFEAAVHRLALSGLQFHDAQRCGLDTLGSALAILEQAAPKIQKSLLEACGECIAFDRQVTTSEAELYRAIADSLHCPMPPLLPGQPL